MQVHSVYCVPLIIKWKGIHPPETSPIAKPIHFNMDMTLDLLSDFICMAKYMKFTYHGIIDIIHAWVKYVTRSTYSSIHVVIVITDRLPCRISGHLIWMTGAYLFTLLYDWLYQDIATNKGINIAIRITHTCPYLDKKCPKTYANISYTLIQTVAKQLIHMFYSTR